MPAHLFRRDWRKCQECGFTTFARYSNHKVWCAKEKRPVYCGFMRLMRDE